MVDRLPGMAQAAQDLVAADVKGGSHGPRRRLRTHGRRKLAGDLGPVHRIRVQAVGLAVAQVAQLRRGVVDAGLAQGPRRHPRTSQAAG